VKGSRFDPMIHHVARGYILAHKVDGGYLSEFRATGRGTSRQIRGRTIAELLRAGAKLYKTRLSARQCARRIYPAGHPA